MQIIKKTNLWNTASSSLLASAVLFSALACGDDKPGEEKGSLKFTLTGAEVTKALNAEGTESGTFNIKVTEGQDDGALYKLKIEGAEAFTGTAYTGTNETQHPTTLTAPINGADLKTLFNVTDNLKKGDTKDIPFTFKAATGQASNGSARVKVTIVDKDSKELVPKVELKWKAS